MSREGLRYQLFSRRALLVAGIQGLAITVLGGRLYYLSIVKGKQFQLQAEANAINLRLIAPERGDILDRNGIKLATNRLDYQVYLIPEQARDVISTLKRLGRIINLSEAALERVENRAKRQRSFLPVTVADDLNFEEFSRVNIKSPDLPGVFTDAGKTRLYPDGDAIAHLVGYVGNPRDDDPLDDPLYSIPGFKVGIQGLEHSFDQELRGVQGTRRVEVNSSGREIRELKPRQDAKKGDELSLTIDMELQHYTKEQLREDSAAAVIMDIQNGDILAMASNPAYDPNEFNLGLSRANWQAMLEDPRKPLINKCLSGTYPPGSTIKMIIALAALEKGVINRRTRVTCTGKHELADQTFHCWDEDGHGEVDLMEALRRSCDVYFYQLAETLDIDDMAKALRDFGFGQTYDLGLSQRSGLVPSRAWKRSALNERWQLGESLNVSIGQGALTANPLQLAVMTARIASGLEVQPRLVQSLGGIEQYRSEGFTPMQANPSILDMMRRGMHEVMRPRGTGYDPSRSVTAPLQAGKTGTAQVRRISQQMRDENIDRNTVLPWRERDHALFVGYAPYDNPQYAVSVLVEHGGGGSAVAAPIGRDLLDKAMEQSDAPRGGDDGDA